ncbi:hypothetical protein FRC01_014874 [Tulasnella sp. 417]|nr:hypothetical protein FRC01_014874 [Tulasnella sp. 417]
MEGHTDSVDSIAFSPDGTRLASGSEDNTVCLWDVEKGEQIDRDIRQNLSTSSPYPQFMPKAYAIRPQDPTRLSQKTALYLQRLQDIKEEHQVLDLIEPQYQYPVTPKVHTPVIYLGKDNKPYDFKKKATRATRRTRIDIAHCPPATLAYLIDNFPESDVSFSHTNLLIPYVPTTETLARAYQVLPIDTTAEYDTI